KRGSCGGGKCAGEQSATREMRHVYSSSKMRWSGGWQFNAETQRTQRRAEEFLSSPRASAFSASLRSVLSRGIGEGERRSCSSGKCAGEQSATGQMRHVYSSSK